MSATSRQRPRFKTPPNKAGAGATGHVMRAILLRGSNFPPPKQFLPRETLFRVMGSPLHLGLEWRHINSSKSSYRCRPMERGGVRLYKMNGSIARNTPSKVYFEISSFRVPSPSNLGRHNSNTDFFLLDYRSCSRSHQGIV